MEADLKTLRDKVLEATRGSPVADNIADISLQTDRDDDGEGFVRVLVQMKNFEKADDEALGSLLEDIERTISSIDERYASVRFLDAA